MSKWMPIKLMVVAVPAIAWVDPAQAGPPPVDEPPVPIRIQVAATRGQIIPQSKGGGGFQRTFRFTAIPGKSNHWLRQVLEVRGTVFDAKGKSTPAHLDVIEYYRVGSLGRTIQPDSHYSQYWHHCGGTLTISSTLTYGTLVPKKRGDTILGKSFILRSAKDAAGKTVTMKTRTTRQVIPAEHGERVEFHLDRGSIPTHYTYRVQWDARPGRGSRTRPSGEMEVGTWRMELPKQTGPTVALVRPRPIPRLKPGR
ncbi:MAG: hypothetical protein ACYTFD_10550 [Planctomycetota bacterium]|jgi:hypothetical protein